MSESDNLFGDRPIPEGKAPPRMLEMMLDIARRNDPRVLIGPAPGEDAAVLSPGPGPIVFTTDPITFPTPRPGYYAVHINANDVAAMGARPWFFLLTMILPPNTPASLAREIMIQATEAADSLGVTLVGGHSEVSSAVNTPLVAAAMIGGLIGSHPLSTGHGRIGDAIVQVGPLAVEGTSILAVEHRERLLPELGREFMDRAADFLIDPGLSVVAPANRIAEKFDVHAMHDPTEGGVATGLAEIAQASGTGVELAEAELIIAPETRILCEKIGYDPLGLISSGSLIFTIAPDLADEAVRWLAEEGYLAARIGVLTDRKGEYVLKATDGSTRPLPVFAADEMTKK